MINVSGRKIGNNAKNVHFGKQKSMKHHAPIDALLTNHTTGIMVNALIFTTYFIKVPRNLPIKELKDNSPTV